MLAALALAACEPATSTDPAPAPPAEVPEGSTRLSEALADPNPFARARALGTLLPTLGPASVPEVKQTLEEFRLDLGAVEFELLLRFWAEQEPDVATQWVFQHGPPLYRINAARTAIEIYAAHDPAGAVVAAEKAIEWGEDIGRVSQMALVRGWFARGNRAELEAYIEGLGSGIQRQRAIFAYALSLAAADGPDAAIRWAETVPEDDQRYALEMYRQVMSALTWADAEAAARMCEAHCDGPYGSGLREILIRTRLRNGEDGASIVEWVGRIPAETEALRTRKNHSLWVAYITWAREHHEDAIAWMEEKLAQPEPPAWLPVLYGEYARQLAAEAPAKAITAAERIEDPGDRARTLVRIARHWLSVDEAAAEAWIEQSSLSERERADARNTAKPHYLPRVKQP